MKKTTKLLSLFISLIMIASTVTACSGDGNDQKNQPETKPSVSEEASATSGAESNNATESESDTDVEASDTQQATETDKEESEIPNANEKFTLHSNKAYTVKVVVPDMSSTAEDVVYTKIRGVLKSLTGVAVTYCSDFLAANQTHDPNEKAILIGNTNYEESVQAESKLAYGQYSIKTTQNKIIFSFTSKAEGLELVEIFEKSIKQENGEFWVSGNLSVSKQKFLQLRDLPKHPSRFNTLIDCNDNTSMVVAEKTTIAQFNDYCDELVKSGYALYSSRDNVNGNYFRTFTKNNLALTVYFTSYSKETRIIAGPIDDIPKKEADTTAETCTPSLTIISQGEENDIGLGFIYLLPNGKFLIFDGGYTLSGKIFTLLQQLAPNKDNITIAAWFVSHPHVDHQQALQTFLRSYKSKVTIESILFNYTTKDQYSSITNDPDNGSGSTSFLNSLNKYVDKSTKIIKPHTGQIYKYGSAEVEIIYTVEDILPKTIDYLNTSSLVIRVKIGNHTNLILADTTHVSGDVMKNMYGSYLESEMVQLAHHGIYPANASLYEAIKAKVLLWPSNYANASAQQTNAAVVKALEHATDVHIANTQDTTFVLPYTFVNNKEEFLSKIQTPTNQTPTTE